MTEKSIGLLTGANDIAAYIGITRRQFYYWAEKGIIPVFKIGEMWVAKKATLDHHFEKLDSDVRQHISADRQHISANTDVDDVIALGWMT